MSITVGSEGMGSWGSMYINFILKKMNFTHIVWKNSDDCEFIIASHFYNLEGIWNNNKKKYIYWSAESYVPKKNTNETKHLNILTTLCNDSGNYIYLPYFLFLPWVNKERKYQTINRRHFVAYCNSNPVKERETMFNLIVNKIGSGTCHSLGRNCGNFPETKQLQVGGGHCSIELIDAYKDYTFVIAMENKCKDGYITEKILNAFYSGAIPIYWGSSNINDFFNEKAFINVNNFSSFEKCVDFIINMSKEDIKRMTEEKIYNTTNELLNIFNENYQNNKTLEKHINIFKKFLGNM